MIDLLTDIGIVLLAAAKVGLYLLLIVAGVICWGALAADWSRHH